MSVESIIAIVNTRMTEALERLKNKIISAIPEEAAEELGEVKVSSFIKKAMKGLHEEIQEIVKDEISKNSTKTAKSSAKAEKGEKKTKKDKNAPKGAKNAYILFCADNRDQVKEENPEMGAKEIISELARLWKEADEDVKAEYQEKAAEDKKRYEEEMSDYVPSEEESPKKGTKGAKGTKKAKDKNAPKGAKNAYILFCADNRDQVKEENPDMGAKEIISELARLWKEADEDVKAEYNEKAAADKQRYQEEMSDYVPSEDEEEKTETKKGAKKDKKDNSPKRPLSSYMLFAQEYRAQAKSEHPEAKAADISKILGAWWKEADEDVKQEFKEKAQKALDKFNGKNGKEEASPKKEESKVKTPVKVQAKETQAKETQVKETQAKKSKK
jgi:hypothetical protein